MVKIFNATTLAITMVKTSTTVLGGYVEGRNEQGVRAVEARLVRQALREGRVTPPTGLVFVVIFL